MGRRQRIAEFAGKGKHRGSQGSKAGRRNRKVDGAAAHFRERYVNCGNGKCCGAGSRGGGHGPYLYLVWREGGRIRERYIGRVDEREE